MSVGKSAADNHPDEKRLHVKIIEFLQEENRIAHHTEMYDLQYPVLRRGTPFKLKIQFEGPYNSNDHSVHLMFATGSNALCSKKTCVKIPLGGRSMLSGWKADATVNGKPLTPEEKTDTILVTVTTPPDAIVGSYQIYVEVRTKEYEHLLFNYNGCAFLIFNPWNKDDVCFMSDENELEEYVLNEDGIIYLGSGVAVVPRHWHYGQFERYFLEAALWLLEKAGLRYEDFGNPAIVSRTLAAMVNASDRGVVAGYDGSEKFVLPRDWPGSVSIIKPFMTKKGRPVRYGADWTFAALFCTLTRSLGIPCRVVTCYNAGHNAEKYDLIDIHWSKDNMICTAINTDQVWIRHTWNEVWFKRHDIPDDMQGWQIIDCTPNSASESLYRLGPCPVKAIQAGKIATIYDAPFIYAATNGSTVHWDVESVCEMHPIAIKQNSLATKVLTKAVGLSEPVDLRASYIDPKMEKDPKTCPCVAEIVNLIAEKSKKEDVVITITPPGDVDMGDFISFIVDLENKSDEPRTVEIYMRAFYQNQKGVLGECCKIVNGERISLLPKSTKSHHVKIRAEEYKQRNFPPFMIKVFMKLTVVETKQQYADTFDVDFKPFNVLRIEVGSKEVTAGVPFECRICIQNPLRKSLHNCILSVEAQEFTRSIKLARPIAGSEKVSHTVGILLRREGESTIYVCLKTPDVLSAEAVRQVKVISPNEKKQKQPEKDEKDAHKESGKDAKAPAKEPPKDAKAKEPPKEPPKEPAKPKQEDKKEPEKKP